MTELPDEPNVNDPRGRIREALSGALSPSQLSYLIDETLAAKKLARGTCRCGKHVDILIPDVRATIAGLTMLLDSALAKPARQDGDDGILNLTRKTILQFTCEHGHRCAECEDVIDEDVTVSGPYQPRRSQQSQ
jgi:hypothetical protein